jgi:hypothetical protein
VHTHHDRRRAEAITCNPPVLLDLRGERAAGNF